MPGLSIDNIQREIARRANTAQADRLRASGYVSLPTAGLALDEVWSIAVRVRHDHATALTLWELGGRENRLLACFVEESVKITAEQMEAWAADFDSLEITEQCCLHAFARAPAARTKAVEWSERSEPFVRQAGFLLMARLGVWEEGHPDARFKGYFSPLPREVHLAPRPDTWWRRAARWFMRRLSGPNRRRAWDAIEDAREVANLRAQDLNLGDPLDERRDGRSPS
jgi:hypothetical protein